MSKYRGYSVYKESGVEWLGDVPEHWEKIRIKFSTYVKGRVGWHGLNSKDFLSTGDYYLVTGTDFKGRNINWETCYRISKDRYEEDAYIHLKDNDILITKDGTIGKIVQVKDIPYKASVNSGVFVTRPLSDNLYCSDFMYYFLNSGVFNQFVDFQKAGSTIHHLYQNTFENFEYCYPADKSEQQQIAAFLDNKTAHLDTLIEKKQQMIGLLNEKRIALITQAVTKGLDLSVPMKDSGVEWLADVPEHWEKVLIKYLLNSMIDTEHKTAPFFEDGQYFVVRTSNIRNGKLLFNNAKYTDHAGYIEWTRRGKPQAGDILFTREAPAGEACIVPEGIDLCVGQRTVLMQVNPNLLNSKYALWSLYGGLAAEFIKILSQGATVAHFNMSDIGNIPILLPLIDEQQKIVDYLDQETAKIDRMINTVQSAIAKLQEYRTALITAAVTGKIDVRTLTPYEGHNPCKPHI